MLLLVIIIIPFVCMDYAGYGRAARGTGDGSGALVYGHKINARDLDHAKRRFKLRMQMNGKGIRPDERSEAWLAEQVLRNLALVEKAESMGITAADEEVVGDARRYFSDKNGQLNQAAYDRFIQEILPQRGLTEAGFEMLIREDIMLRKMMMLVASTAKVTPQQSSALVTEVTDKVTASACRFEFTDYTARVKPSEADLQGFYKQNMDRFRTPEQARVAYVVFPVDPTNIPQDDQAISDEELKAAYEARAELFRTSDGKSKPLKDVAELLRHDIRQQKAHDVANRRATDFTVKLIPEQGKPQLSFEELAKKEGVVVKETDFFNSNQLAPGIQVPSFTHAAFKLSEDNPISDVVPSESAVYVLKLLAKKPSGDSPFEQVRESVKSALVTSLALKLAREDGEKKREELENLLGTGKTFAQASAELKLKPQTFKNFSAMDSAPAKSEPFEGAVRQVSMKLSIGSVGKFIPTVTGGLFVYVSAREHAKFEDLVKVEPMISQMLVQREQQQVVRDFEKSVMDEAGLKFERPSSPLVIDE